jgi:hypothetical protein
MFSEIGGFGGKEGYSGVDGAEVVIGEVVVVVVVAGMAFLARCGLRIGSIETSSNVCSSVIPK